MLQAVVFMVLAAEPGRPPSERVEFALRQPMEEGSALRLCGPNARQYAKPDGQGLRITLPASRADRGSVGVEARFYVRGDFEITLACEVLAVDQQAPADGAGASLWLKFASPKAGGASVTRLRKGTKEVFGASRITLGRDGKDRYQTVNVPAAGTRGRLRLVRTGPTLRYLVAEEAGEFQEIHSAEVGTEDVTNLRALAVTGGKPAGADVRLVDWSIQGASLPNRLAVPPSPGGGWGWLVWTAAAVLLLVLGSGTACYFFPEARGFLRRWRRAPKADAEPAGAQPGPKRRPTSGSKK